MSYCKVPMVGTDREMKGTYVKSKLRILAALLLAPLVVHAETALRLPALFGDHMVLQCEQAVPVWGWAKPGEEVTVEFAGQKKTTRADVAGKWLVKLDPLKVNAEPQDLKVGSLVINDVLVGDVWLCSGQSNMGMNVGGSANAEQEIASANFPAMRLFSVAQNPSLTPTNDVKGQWEVCSPQTVGNFSAAAYFFGRELQRELNIPVGLLHSSVGGTPAEAWTRLAALHEIPGLGERAEQEIAQFKSQDDDNRKFVGARAAWEGKYGVKPPPIAETARGWAEPGLDTSDWKPVTLPAQWRNLGAKSGGVFWLRKEFTLPEAVAEKPLWLSLDWVSEQYDTVFFNGVEVGHASDKPPGFYMVQRGYSVPAKLVKAGRAVVAVRVVSATQNAGVSQRGRSVFPFAKLANVDDNWLMKTEAVFAPLPADALPSRPKPNNIAFRNVPSALYNGMIAPVVPFAIKGAIWYQGESNTTRSLEYGDLLSLMIRDWRGQWHAGDFPFYIVQLANYYGAPKEPGKRSGVAEVREQQLKVSQRVPNCGLAVAIDIGEEGIHPRNKQDVGKRLALQALHHTYGRNVPCSGPIYRAMKVTGSTIRVTFDHAEGGLVAKGGTLKWFAISGADKKFVWADAKIRGDTVVVSSPQVPQPVAVRYAWADNPEGCNLYNQAGLPASPFRTDDWQ